jgi:hypothetical protein
MLSCLDEDVRFMRKRNQEMKAEANVAAKHASQCELLDASSRFGQLQLVSKTAIAKTAQLSQFRQTNDLLNAAERGLQDEVSGGLISEKKSRP